MSYELGQRVVAKDSGGHLPPSTALSRPVPRRGVDPRVLVGPGRESRNQGRIRPQAGLRSQPLQRGTPLRRGKPMARTRMRSQAERIGNADYDACRERVSRRDRGVCVCARLLRVLAPEAVPFPAECRMRLDPHHVLRPEDGGGLADDDNVVTICRAHHSWVHTARNHQAAKGLGLLAETPDELAAAQGRLRELLEAA